MGWITDVDGIKVGHFTDSRRPTGCTVVLYETGAVAGVDVRGSAPGTRETDLLNPINTVDKVHAIVLSGGSAFGLDTAAGVMRWLEERGYGYQTAAAKVPIVPAAILYDLGSGDPKIRPDAAAGYQACASAKSGPVEEGSVGAGAGATISKLAGAQRVKGGIGTSSIALPNGIVVGAIVAVNAVGDVIDPKTGKVFAGSDIVQAWRSGVEITRAPRPGESTTIGIVATNAAFNKTEMTKIAQMAHDGIARAVNPAHTPFDGDTLFSMSTAGSTAKIHHGIVGALAAEVVSEAILRAVDSRRS
jgi:L-aminopeptidase/D-esterase-like protein